MAPMPKNPKIKNDRIDLRVSAEERARWTAAADAVGLSLSAWLRMLATVAARDLPTTTRAKGGR